MTALPSSLFKRRSKPLIPDDAGQVRLTFFRIFNFEPGFDGGVPRSQLMAEPRGRIRGLVPSMGGHDGKVTAVLRTIHLRATDSAWMASRGKPGVFLK